MDKTDSVILTILKENSRASASDISKQVSLSVPAVTERIRKLEQTDVIEKYTIRVNPGASGYNLLAFILVKMDYSRNMDVFQDTCTTHRHSAWSDHGRPCHTGCPSIPRCPANGNPAARLQC